MKNHVHTLRTKVRRMTENDLVGTIWFLAPSDSLDSIKCEHDLCRRYAANVSWIDIKNSVIF